MKSAAALALTRLAAAVALIAAPSGLAHHSPFVDLVADLPLPHQQFGARLLAAPAVVTASGEPDLYPFLPETPIGGVPNFYVDSFAEPGKLLYRFDTVIANAGGALHVYCDNCQTAPQIRQVIWPGGAPPADDLPDPTRPPIHQEYAVDIAPRGASMVYSSRSGHHHWHYQLAAWYELVVPGQGAIRDGKVGFCMYDTWGGSVYFPSNNNAWCRFQQPTANFVAMGISSNKGDFYSAFLNDQWIDATGVLPGSYELRATVNPNGTLIEVAGGTANNVLSTTRTIPGTVAAPGSATVPAGRASQLTLSGQIVGATVPSVRNATCSLRDATCFVTASATQLTFAIRSNPAHGTVRIDTTTGLTATVTYTPTAGYTGPDAFTFTVTDSRGLVSRPATISLDVAGTTANTPPSVQRPADQTGVVGQPASLQVVASDAENDPLTYTATGLPPGLTINQASGLISGTPTQAASGSVGVTVSDGRAQTQVSFAWTIQAAASCGGLSQEAEAATLTGDFAVITDRRASGGRSIAAPVGAPSSLAGPTASRRASFCFTVVTAGTYRVVATVRAPSGSSDSFYADIDGTPTGGYLWDLPRGTGYRTDALSHRGGADPVLRSLTVGNHTLNVYVREPGARLDTVRFERVAG